MHRNFASFVTYEDRLSGLNLKFATCFSDKGAHISKKVQTNNMSERSKMCGLRGVKEPEAPDGQACRNSIWRSVVFSLPFTGDRK